MQWGRKKLPLLGIKMAFKEIWYESVTWVHRIQGRIQWRALVNTAMNLWDS
jgi:hypothetical protein